MKASHVVEDDLLTGTHAFHSAIEIIPAFRVCGPRKMLDVGLQKYAVSGRCLVNDGNEFGAAHIASS